MGKGDLQRRPVLVRGGDGWAEYRLEFAGDIVDETAGVFLALNLVAGEACAVETGAGTAELRFDESMVVPASVGAFGLHNLGERPCRVVKAFVET